MDPAEGSATFGCLSLRGDFAGGSLFAGPEFLEGAREVNVGRSSESFSWHQGGHVQQEAHQARQRVSLKVKVNCWPDRSEGWTKRKKFRKCLGLGRRFSLSEAPSWHVLPRELEERFCSAKSDAESTSWHLGTTATTRCAGRQTETRN